MPIHRRVSDCSSGEVNNLPLVRDIFSISIDKSEEAWRKASLEEQLPWTNTLNSTEELTNNAQKAYNVSAIPANYMIDPSGKIVARNLRGQQLTEFLEKTLK